MTAREKLHSTALFLCSAGLLVAAAPGCSSTPPDTSSPPPEVDVVSPEDGQVLTAGQPINVLFTISGIDKTGPMPVAFALSDGAVKVPGQGKVRAFIDQSAFLAQTTTVPGAAEPLLVPDGVNGMATDLVTSGAHELTLILFYNDDTKVEPQEQAAVSFTVQ